MVDGPARETSAPVPAGVARVFDAVLAEEPGREALVTAGGRWSYADLDAMADGAAAALADLGVRAGDRVAACLPNGHEVVAAFHGAMRLGAIWVGINRALAPPEKAFILSDSGSSIFLGDAASVAELSGALPGDLTGLRELVDVGGAEWQAATGRAAARVPGTAAAGPLGSAGRAQWPDVDPFAPAAIAYTSGTTGYPKGAVHSQHNLLMPGAAVVASRGYGPGLRKGDCLPLTILNMLVLTTLLVAQAGGTCVVMDKVEAVSVAEWIERERVTVWNGVPALLHTIAHDDTIPAESFASLHELWVGGADCPDSLRAAVAAKLGLPVTHTYGLTEAPTIVAIDDPPAADRIDRHVTGASGRPLPHLSVRIVDAEGSDVADGESGEICVTAVGDGSWSGAYRPCLGYWQKPEATDALLSGGVVHTGDIGAIDSSGHLHIRDRKNQMILRGGANVYPAEVERVLAALPEVTAAAVVGLPDERLGQRVAAVVQLSEGGFTSPGADEGAGVVQRLTEACRAELAGYKVPERWVFVDGFQRNSMGKIDRRSLNELFPPVL